MPCATGKRIKYSDPEILKSLLSRKFLLFLIKLGGLFLVYYVWFKPNAWTMPFVGAYYSHFMHYTMKFVVEPSVWCLERIGYDVQIISLKKIAVSFPPFTLRMQNACLGTDMMFAFAALVIAFPGKWIHRIWFLPLGWLGIELANIIRVVGLCLVWLNYGTGGPIDHHDFFNLITTLFVLGMFLFWVKLYRNQNN